MGTWVGCVEGEQVLYPQAFGVTDWNDVPYGSIIRNDDFACLDGVTIDSVNAPRILPGSTHFGVTPPTELAKTWYQIRVLEGETETTTAMSGTSLLLLSAPAESADISIRQLIDGVWTPWSTPHTYTPGAAAEAPTCAGLYASTSASIGTPDVDIMIGSIFDDEINARGGDDVICTLAGNDSILAGPGKDLVFAGVGDDIVSGGRGADIIFAEAGSDNVRGGDGPDQIHGGSGDDTVHGTAGNDIVDGGNGDDLVIGGIGHDRVKGSADNDTLEGRNGRDVLFGGNGDDDLAGGNGLDRLVGGAGTDRLDGEAGSDRCVTADGDEMVACER
jgi:Ca2+-binding RTX toxin-like protein